MTDYLYDKSGDDPAVRELEGLLADYAHRAPLRTPPARRRSTWRTAAAAGTIAVAAAVVAIAIWRRPSEPDCTAGGPGFAFAVDGGAARCGGDAATRGTLPIGAWLETADRAVADVRIADIGNLKVFGDSRLRLVGTGAGGHHLELARGRVAARVVAPPRLFVVDTPGATAVDLGCAYELAVDGDGRTHLRVTSGAVSLEGKGLAAYAPMDTEVVAAPGRGPGTPVAIAASPALRAAVARFDAGDAGSLAAVITAATGDDTVTLWNLLSRTKTSDRAAVVARLEQLGPRPDSVRAEDVIAGDAAAIARWRDALEERWICPGCFGGKGKR
jgi:ferric-dicitrate binding protein FerR (iron transport regulator)